MRGAIVPAEHHRLLIDELEAVESGETTRLMVLMPPGSAKSTYASALFPPWFMGRNPANSVLGVSNTAELAERFSRRARNLVADPRHTNVFRQGVRSDNAAAGRWEADTGAEYFAAGVGAAIAGRRADLGLIDDPIRTREEADSKRIRDKQWDWYVNDFLTRLKPGGRQIVIQTRWHEDDLSGRILEREADKWRVVKLPMIAAANDPLGREPGERLWPEWFTAEMVDTAKQDMRGWNALYQQEPAPEDGDYFKREWLGEYEKLPGGLRYYGASDFAVTNDAGDWTEHCIVGADAAGNLYIVDWWRGRKSPDEWIERMLDMVIRYNPAIWFGEAGPIRRSIEPFLMRRMDDRSAICRIEWMASVSDKEARARSIQALMSMGKVFWPKNALWKTEVVTQLLKFPSGQHDDAVDALSLIGRGLASIRMPKLTHAIPMRPTQKRQWRAGVGGI